MNRGGGVVILCAKRFYYELSRLFWYVFSVDDSQFWSVHAVFIIFFPCGTQNYKKQSACIEHCHSWRVLKELVPIGDSDDQ